MIKNVEQCFLCLLSIWMFSLENYSVFLFFNWVVCFVDVECMRCLHTFDINPCWSYHIFLHSVSQFSQFSHSVVSDSLRPHKLQHARPPCPSPTPGVYSNSCPLSQWLRPHLQPSLVRRFFLTIVWEVWPKRFLRFLSALMFCCLSRGDTKSIEMACYELVLGFPWPLYMQMMGHLGE